MRFEKLRISLARKGLKKLPTRAKVLQPANWDAVSTIGIIACGSHPLWLEKTCELLKDLRQDGKKVSALVYIDLPKNTAIPATPEGVTVFTQHDLKFDLSSKSAAADEFIQQRFDMLWDLNTSLELSLIIASRLSQAGFKAGMEDELNKHLDFSISMRSMTQDGEKLWGLIENLKKYLKQLHYS